MNAEHIYKELCNGFFPIGPCGITIEAIQERIDRYQGPYKYPFDYRFMVQSPFMYKKQALFNKYISEQGEKPKEKAKPKKDELTVRVEKENARVTHEWDAFEKGCPGMWADMSEACHLKAAEIAEKQGLRHRKIFGPLTIEG